MKYYLDTRKLQKIWEKVGKNELDIADLKKYGILIKSVQHFKNNVKYDSGWVEGKSTSINLNFEKVPENFLTSLKIIPMVKTEEGWENSDYVDDFVLYKKIIRTNEEDREDNLNDYELYVSLTVTTTDTVIPLYSRIMVYMINKEDYSEISLHKT